MTLANSTVIGFTRGPDESIAQFSTPGLAHAFPGVTTVALTNGPFAEHGSFDSPQISFVDPSLRDGHDAIAVVEHEGIAIGVSKKVESINRPGRAFVDGFDSLIPALNPDELAFPFISLILDPLGIGFSVTTGPADVARSVDDPDQSGILSILETDLCHAEGRGPDKIRPPPVMLLVFIT